MQTSPRQLWLLLALVASPAFVACGSLELGAGPRHAVARRHAPRRVPYDVEHYAIDLALDPGARAIEGTCTVRLWPKGRALREVALDLAKLDVRGVRDGEGRELSFTHRGETLTIELAERLEAGDFVELTVAYGGTPVRGLWFSDVEQGQPTQVFTQGQCEDARFWFPCFDAPADRATSELRVTMPAQWTAVAAGERIERVDHGDGTASELWRMHDPHPTYLTSLVAGELTVIEGRYGNLPLSYLVEDDWVDGAWPGAVERAMGMTPEVLAFMEELTGRRYPYVKYSQACVEGFLFGGMENVSATTMTETLLRDERGARDYDAVDLVVHEAAHQWFGNLLTCADWSEIWLNEGFATYATLLWYEARGELDEFRAQLRDAQEDYMRGDIGEWRRPIVHDTYVDPLDLFFGGHTYSGGATRLHLLRHELGDDDFFAGIKRYVADHENSSVVTADLRAAFEAESGRDLEGCFDQWLHRGGFPELRWSWKYADGRVTIDVEQVQDPADAPRAFDLPVDVELRLETGSELHRVRLDQRSQSFEIPAVERPLWVHFDRFGWIPKAERVERPVEEWIAIASLDEDVNARRDAVGVLGDALAASDNLEDRRYLALVLIERLIEDGSHHVRSLAAEMLGGQRLPPALDALGAAAQGDPEAGVRISALDALARLGEDPSLAAFATDQFEAGYSWETMVAAARLFASAAPDEALGFLTQRLSIDSPHDVLRAGLLAALGRSLDSGGSDGGVGDQSAKAAIQVLRGVAFDEGASEWARLSAVNQLASAGRYDSDLRLQLAELLASTRHYRLQTGLIEVLAYFEDPRFVSVLTDFHERCEDPRQRRTIERILREPWAR